MRPRLEKLSAADEQQSFRAAVIRVRTFELFWHYHPEYELTYIVKGKGKRIVGDSVSSFKAGDLVLAGPLLPHVWVSEGSFSGPCEAIVLHFTPAFLQGIQAFPELNAVVSLFQQAERGLCFRHKESMKLETLLRNVVVARGSVRFNALLQLFQPLLELPKDILSSPTYRISVNARKEKRINRILDYVQHHFQSEISLSVAASHLHLSESAFCKYFRRNFNQTFSDYVNDVRIAHAAKLLIETDLPVHTIAVRSGFDNQSYFNRIFLKKKKVKPLQFRLKK